MITKPLWKIVYRNGDERDKSFCVGENSIEAALRLARSMLKPGERIVGVASAGEVWRWDKIAHPREETADAPA